MNILPYMRPGGISPEKKIEDDQYVYNLALKTKTEIEIKLDKRFNIYEPLKYRYQVVAGMIYYIKIQVSKDYTVHVKLVDHLPHKKKDWELIHLEYPHTLNDTIHPF